MNTSDHATKFNVSVQEGHLYSPSVGRNCPAAAGISESLLAILPQQYHALRSLAAEACAGTRSANGRFPLYDLLSVEQFEMLEAELRNQGLLSGLPDYWRSVAQHAVHRTSVLRWQALRLGLHEREFQFAVDPCLYLLLYAQEICHTPGCPHQRLIGLDSVGPQCVSDYPVYDVGSDAQKMLTYLDRFAAYLNGEFQPGTNRYERGLNVVLRSLHAPSKEQEDGCKIKPDENLIVLPITFRALAQRLKTQSA